MAGKTEHEKDKVPLSKEAIQELYGKAEMAMRDSPNISTLNALKNVCYIEAYFDDETSTRGSGFLVSSPYPTKLIMTAGHNLITTKKKRATRIEVTFGDEPPISLPSVEGRYMVSQSYASNPDKSNGVNDYGFIIIDRQIKLGGIGFSLLHDIETLRGREATVIGFPGSVEGNDISEVELFSSNGKILSVSRGQVEYNISTEGGQSGGPVCIAEDNDYVAIAIHNYAKPLDREGNLGTLLTCNIIFEMLEELYVKISLELWIPSKRDPENNSNIFLKIPPGRLASALAQGGKDKYTTMSFIPVETYRKKLKRTKYIIATPHLKPPTYLTFEGERVFTAGELELRHNRPTEKHVVEIFESPVNGTPFIQIGHGESPPFLLRIDETQVTVPDTDGEHEHTCDCIIPEWKIVNLVDSNKPNQV